MRSQKRCPRCRVTQPGEAFGWNPNGRLRTYCRPCFRKVWREWYHLEPNRQRHLAQVAARKRRRRKRNREIVLEAKSRPCADCGKTYPYYVMDFDHLGDKVAAVSYLVPSYGPSTIVAEIAKCEVVCANCHRIRSFTRLHRETDLGTSGAPHCSQDQLPGLADDLQIQSNARDVAQLG